MSNLEKEEDDYIGELFLKFDKNSLPFPKNDPKYENLVLEIMKSGCNRQIAEYAVIKYKEIEDSENDKKKLSELQDIYNNSKEKIFDQIKNQEIIKNILEKKNAKISKIKEIKDELNDYDYEIEELLDFFRNKIKEGDDVDSKMKEIERVIKHYLYEIIIEKKDSEEIKKFLEDRKNYMEKREAVIEAALRKVRKIVNDKKEYKIFYREYFGKDEEKEMEFKIFCILYD